MRVLTLGGLVGPLLFASVVVLAASLRPDYSHVGQFISELGATGAPNAGLLNYAGFIPAGLMLGLFGLALGAKLPRDRLAVSGAILVIVFGAGLTASGLFSCDPGCPQSGGSIENLVHDRIAPLAFLSLILGAALLGLRFRSLPAWRRLSTYSLATSAVGLCLLIALASSLESRSLTGLWQRLLLAALFSWCVVVALHAFRAEHARPGLR